MTQNLVERVVPQHCECTPATRLCTLRWLILSYVNFTSIKKKSLKQDVPRVKLFHILIAILNPQINIKRYVTNIL